MSVIKGPPAIAVVAHLYYEEQWPELAALIRLIRSDFALFVTIRETSSAASLIRADFPHATVRPVPNLGRDVLPFLMLLPELQGFDLVCKLHTKRNAPRFRPWQLEALRGVLGGSGLIDLIVGTFAQVPELMIAGSGAVFVDGHFHMYGAQQQIEAVLPNLPKAFGFFAGTMFWARPQLFADFGDIFPASQFVPHVDIDGHPEHAVERLFGARIASLGGSVGLTRTSVGVPVLDVLPAGLPASTTFWDDLFDRMKERYGRYPADWYLDPALVARAPLGELPPK